MRYLVDTDVIIDGLRGVPSAVTTLREVRQLGGAISAITLGEVLDGAYATPRPADHLATSRRFLEGVVVLPIDEQVAETFARLRADLRRQGNLIADLDLLIAATAVTHSLELLTRNARHFARVPGLRLHPPS